MLRKTWTGWVIAASVAAAMTASCGGDEDDGGDTNAATVTMPMGTADDGGATMADDGGATTMADDDGMATTMAPGDDDGQTTAADMCDPPCAAGEQCIAGECFGGDDTAGMTDDGMGGCPAGETCQATGGGGMACLGEPTHCVLPCAAGACPEPMACDAGGACSYDAMNLPAEGNPDYPPPTGGACPEGYLGAMFAAGTVVCIPECEAGACPGGGVCAVNPTSSGMPC